MKVDEITEGFWDTMAGALNPMSRKNMIGSQKKDPSTGQPMTDASGNPIHNTAADYAASMKRPSVDDYEAQYRQQYLGQADAIEKGALSPDHISSVTRRGIDQTRREAGMKPVDWEHLDITTNKIDPRTLTPDQQSAVNAKRTAGGHAPIDWTTKTNNYVLSQLDSKGEQANSLKVDPASVLAADRTRIDRYRSAQGKAPINWSERESSYRAMKATA